MSDPAPVARVDGRDVREILATPKPYAIGVCAGLAAVVLAMVADAGTVFPAVSTGASAVAIGAVTFLAVLCVSAAGSAARDTAAVRFYRDELDVTGRSVVGDDTVTVSYDDVDLVVRTSGGDVATYELVRSGKERVVLRNVTDPETVERTLFELVPSPRERNERAREATDRSMAQRLSDRVPMAQLGDRVEDEGDGDRPIGHERAFWRQWPSDHPLPDSPILGQAAYRRVMAGQSIAMSDAPEREGNAAVVDSGADVEDLARGRHSENAWGELSGSGGAWFDKEKNRIEDGEHDY